MQLLAHGTKQITTLLLDANLFLLLEKEQIHTLHQRILPCFHLQMCQRYAVKLGFVLHVTQIQCIGCTNLFQNFIEVFTLRHTILHFSGKQRRKPVKLFGKGFTWIYFFIMIGILLSGMRCRQLIKRSRMNGAAVVFKRRNAF